MRRADLLKHLENLKPAISAQDMVPIFCNYCFGDGRVLTYNDQLAISAPAVVDAEFGVHAPTLFGLLKNSRAEEVTFSLNADILQIKVGKSNLKLPYLPKTDFIFEEPKDKWDVELDLTPDLVSGLDACLLTSAKENTLPGMMGVTVAVMDSGVNLYSCDGDAISRYGDNEGTVTANYTMPNEFCDVLVRRFKDGGTGTLMVSNDWAKATLSDGYAIYGRILFKEDPFDYPNEIQNTLTTDPVYRPTPTGFTDALSRACVLGEHDTQVTVGNDKLVLVTDTNSGYLRDAFRFKEHPDMTAKVSASMMKRSLEVCGEMAVLDNCTVYRKGNQLLQVIGNVGE